MYELEKNSIGEKIRWLRYKRDIPQKVLATYLNVSRKTISNWERDISRPSYESLIEMTKIFNVPIDYFLNARSKEAYNNRIHKKVVK